MHQLFIYSSHVAATLHSNCFKNNMLLNPFRNRGLIIGGYFFQVIFSTHQVKFTRPFYCLSRNSGLLSGKVRTSDEILVISRCRPVSTAAVYKCYIYIYYFTFQLWGKKYLNDSFQLTCML